MQARAHLRPAASIGASLASPRRAAPERAPRPRGASVTWAIQPGGRRRPGRPSSRPCRPRARPAPRAAARARAGARLGRGWRPAALHHTFASYQVGPPLLGSPPARLTPKDHNQRTARAAAAGHRRGGRRFCSRSPRASAGASRRASTCALLNPLCFPAPQQPPARRAPPTHARPRRAGPPARAPRHCRLRSTQPRPPRSRRRPGPGPGHYNCPRMHARPARRASLKPDCFPLAAAPALAYRCGPLARATAAPICRLPLDGRAGARHEPAPPKPRPSGGRTHTPLSSTYDLDTIYDYSKPPVCWGSRGGAEVWSPQLQSRPRSPALAPRAGRPGAARATNGAPSRAAAAGRRCLGRLRGGARPAAYRGATRPPRL